MLPTHSWHQSVHAARKWVTLLALWSMGQSNKGRQPTASSRRSCLAFGFEYSYSFRRLEHAMDQCHHQIPALLDTGALLCPLLAHDESSHSRFPIIVCCVATHAKTRS